MHSSSAEGAFIIDDPAAISALASPLRQRIIDAIISNGPLTVAEVSAIVGRPADRLYYHIRLLERRRLIFASPMTETNGRAEARFDVPGRPMYLRYRPASLPNRRAVERTVEAMLRTARRDFSRSIARKDVRVEGPNRELWASRAEGNLSEADLVAVNELLTKILSRMMRFDSAQSRATRPYQITWVLSPEVR